MKYQLVVCGGTFDLLHKGHKKFITSILEQSEKVLIGLTSDKYTKEFKANILENFEIRNKNLEDFLKSIDSLPRVEIVSIDNIYGPLLDKNLKADRLFITPETKNGAVEINKKRESLGLPKIEVVVVEMEKAEDGEVISSSRIRNGTIDREGRLYVDPKWKGEKLILPRDLRGELAKPFGRVLNFVPNHIDPDKTITIGDITTQKFNKKNIGQRLSIVDFVVERKRKFDKLEDLGFEQRIETQLVENPAGEITRDLFKAIKKALLESDRSVILVNGEEDLAVLPAITIAPLGFRIYYGQPNIGLVEIEVTEEKKKETRDLVNKFELS